ncbi:uncharacterized protein LOC119092088 [Pollicipes pollicipes]|uniref:uncharacterized protein LOC119092088 n=1 Tax=Pollicipes pollicipes TaxID=41117 RepID=UPI001884A70D|nr:uncharacterized protein LOC119092088 [Pollicipes pollicipes]
MLRQTVLLTLLAAALAQAPGMKPENRDSSYATYDPSYQTYSAQPYPYQSGGHGKYGLGSILAGVALPSVNDIITGIIYVVAVASVAGIALVGVALVLKLLGLKLPLIADLKNQVLSKVDKVDARMLESAWDILNSSIEKFQKL